MESAVLIAGLGNPGREYVGTRHNAGFMVLERLAADWGGRWESQARFQCELARVRQADRVVWLCRPQTYMNRSGESVAAVAAYHRVDCARWLVVVDDADLPLGTLRLRPDGRSGGHHGLESIEAHAGSSAYARQRIGIGRQATGAREITGHVLGRFLKSEQALLEQVLDRAVRQAACWVQEGTGPAMNRYNGSVVNAETM